ncbi:HMG box family protein [Tritrichomonas foetus]|uniref:HMG box family protein n=1 Tax=Tritrichomonas foetus TaxID=1144522 RepID=A0A1J4KRK1_9EUKA|nr:HMG box family protein [Tritrichomonas foetus]|eukprot:OHT13895.1 HMG box family protein [Tritrichomonas foetus]
MNNEPENPLAQDPIQQIVNMDLENSVDIKRPPNAFIIFYRNCKPEILKAKENLTANEIDRMIGNMWHMADEETRSQYREQAKQLAEIFKNVHPDFIDSSRKRKNPSQLSKVPEPIRIRVILKADQPQQIPLQDDPLAELKTQELQPKPNSNDANNVDLNLAIGMENA